MIRFVTTPNFLICLSLVVLGLGFAVPFLILGNPKEYVFVMVSGGAISGFLFTAAIKFHSEMRDRAFEFLVEQRRNDQLFKDASLHISIHFRLNPNLSINDVKQLWRSTENYETKLRNDILTVGNVFETIAISIRHKEVHEGLLQDFYAGILVSYYEKLKDSYLPVIRNYPHLDEPLLGNGERIEIFCDLDWLYRRWKPRYDGLKLRLHDEHNWRKMYGPF
jgi:hypothetical protein